MQRANSLEKTLMLRKAEGNRRRGQQRMTWLEGITDSMDSSLSKLWETLKEASVHGVTKSCTWLWLNNNNMTKESSYWGKDNLVNKQHWKNWTAICKRMKLNTKIHSKWIKKKKKTEIIKLLEEHIGDKLLISVLAMIFLYLTLKAKVTKAKIYMWDYIKLKSFAQKRNNKPNEKLS